MFATELAAPGERVTFSDSDKLGISTVVFLCGDSNGESRLIDEGPGDPDSVLRCVEGCVVSVT